jgi:hypothetical protein
MRISLLLIPLSLCAAPGIAQPLPDPPQVPPATVDRAADAMQSLSKAFLDLPVGEVQAAVEGRKSTSADRHRTVASETGLSARELQQRIAAAKPQIEQSVEAINRALPEITQDLQRAQQSIQRALSNMPDPNYPRR